MNAFLFTLCSIFAVQTVLSGAQVFYGQDAGGGELTRLAATPQSNAARSRFTGSLTQFSIETFETLAGGAPFILSLPDGLTISIGGSGAIRNVASGTDGFGRYPISGLQYLEAPESFTIAFSRPVAALGFHAVDVGDFAGQLRITTVSGGTSNSYGLGAPGEPGGSVLFFGVVDRANPFSSVTFTNSGLGADFFALDDLIVDTAASAVPEPSSSVLLLGGLIGLWAVRRRGRCHLLFAPVQTQSKQIGGRQVEAEDDELPPIG